MDAHVSPLDIGRCARATGVPAKTIRYYESIGLLAPPKRAQNGYRLYGGAEIETLRFVRRARDLGFSLGEIAKLLTLWRDKNRASADVKALALEHARALDERIARLDAMRKTILELAERCHGDRRPDCPILADIASGADRKPPRPSKRKRK
ncbi:MAG: Cu(I)-responsive transcriptional regulator [Rhodospirillales bacterium]|nr:Cu(I)-responsive transcriptional regulator [Rhodospirillales bacterium]